MPTVMEGNAVFRVSRGLRSTSLLGIKYRGQVTVPV
jgi:hypothetical protein